MYSSSYLANLYNVGIANKNNNVYNQEQYKNLVNNAFSKMAIEFNETKLFEGTTQNIVNTMPSLESLEMMNKKAKEAMDRIRDSLLSFKPRDCQIDLMGKMNMFNGLKIIESEYLVDTKTIRRSKKKRLNKKLNKKYGPKIISKPKQDIYVFEDKVVGHPDIIRRIKEAIKNEV